VCETKFFLPVMLAIGCCLFLSLSPGCGDDEGEGVAPTISNLFLGPTSVFVLPRGGWEDVTVSMGYADPDGDIAFVRMSFRYCGVAEVQHEDIAPMGITGDQAGEIWISARVPAECPAGNYLYEFSVFDQMGHQSNTLEATFTLTPMPGLE
jgi:hypothetical protein